MSDTMVSQAWVNEPIHTHVGPMEHHVVAPTLRGAVSMTYTDLCGAIEQIGASRLVAVVQ